MRAFVFTDRALERQAGRFVWLSINGEKRENAAVTKRLGLNAYPTFYVLDPGDGSVALRWVGGATTPQLVHILDDGASTVARRGHARDALARADSLYAASSYAEAAKEYEAALAGKPASWPSRRRVTESLLFALSTAGEYERCAQHAAEALAMNGRGAAALTAAANGLDCALSLPPEHARRKEWVDAFEAKSRALVADTTFTVSADDRSGVYITLADAREKAGDDAGRKKVLGEWASFLEGAAARAKTPEQRSVFDPHRLSAYLELEQPERAIPMLEATARDFPDDYNPYQRLATAYKAMKRWPDALAASDSAVARAYGPRKLLILQTRTDIYLGMADSTAARRTLDEAVSLAEGLPEGQRSDRTIASLRKRREGLGASSR